jgi:hypothetical protein
MNAALNAIAQSAIARTIILALVAVPLVLYFGFTPAERSAIALSAAYYLGFYSPAAGLAATVGWLTWSWKWFWITMGIGFGLTALLHLRSAGFFRLDPCGPGRLRGGGFLHRLCLCYGSALLQETDLIISYEQ